MAQGYIMALMVFIQNIHVFNCRSENTSAFKISLWQNKLILYGVACSIGLHLIIMEVPFLSAFLKTTTVPYKDMLWLFLIGLSVLYMMELYKKIKINFSK